MPFPEGTGGSGIKIQLFLIELQHLKVRKELITDAK